MKKVDVLITGGGFTGLLAAVALKSYDAKRNINVVEQGTYSSLIKNQKPIILTPLSRQLLHKLTLYEKYNYYEGRYQVYSFVNNEYGLSFKIPDTSIIPYGTFLQIMLNIAKTWGIEVAEGIKVLDYNLDEKYVVTVKGNIPYDELIIAEGNKKLTYDENEIKVEGDIKEYCFNIKSINELTAINFNKADKVFYIGDYAGYKDRLLDINCSFGIISALYAAECIANKKDSKNYYNEMLEFEREIEASSYLCYNKEKCIELIPQILLGEQKYSSIKVGG